MNRKRILTIFLITIPILFFLSCKEKSMDGRIIFTRISGKAPNSTAPQDINSQIATISPDGSDLEILTKDFFSAIAPSISFDGKCLLFAGKLKSVDSWKIYEMNLKSRKIKQIISLNDNCLYPAYLPDGEIVFSRLSSKDSLQSPSSLYSCKMDGSDLKRLTFNPDLYSFSTVLQDGRILSLTSVTTETIKTSAKSDGITTSLNSSSAHQHLSTSYMAMRPDGTKCELFFKGYNLFSKAYEMPSRRLVFIESSGTTDSKRNIATISYNDPLFSHNSLTEETKGDFLSVFPISAEKLLVSYSPEGQSNFGLYEFDPGKKSVGRPLYTSEEYSVSDIVVVNQHERPKKLPSEVDTNVHTGLLLCQNLNEWGMNENHADSAVSIEVLGLNSSMGLVPVEKDGSFFLKINADTPFKLRMLDSKGTLLQNSCNWMWLRPNERRGCIGCHEDPAEVPQNRVPEAVRKSPVELPIQASLFKDKTLAKK
jgi:hypothetical protein